MKRIEKLVTLNAELAKEDLGCINLEATTFAKLQGKKAPDWNVTEARGLEKGVKVSDFKGKWLLLEFWGYW